MAAWATVPNIVAMAYFVAVYPDNPFLIGAGKYNRVNCW